MSTQDLKDALADQEELAKRHNRFYLLTQALAFCVAVGAIVTSVFMFLYPDRVGISVILESVSSTIVFLWAACFAIGGVASFAGIISQSLNLEELGMKILAACYIAIIIPPVIDPITSISPFTWSLVIGSGFGCLARAFTIRTLYHHGGI